MFHEEDLVKIAHTSIPFGKYRGRVLIDLPEEYLVWFAQKGFPKNELGRLLDLTLNIKGEGLAYLIYPLKKEKYRE